jgi:hypothetical protein
VEKRDGDARDLLHPGGVSTRVARVNSPRVRQKATIVAPVTY